MTSDQDTLSEYRFNTGQARHLFCTRCGIKSFYVPRSHPDGFSINFNCLDDTERLKVTVKDFDGRHWRQNISRLDREDD